MNDMAEKFKAKVLNSGRVTIPFLIREMHGIETDDIVELQFVQKVTVSVKEAVD